jgi:hypothetical protein
VGVELFHAGGKTDIQTDRQTYRQTDRHKEANSHFSQFCERAYKNVSISVLTFAVPVNYGAVLSEFLEEGLYII